MFSFSKSPLFRRPVSSEFSLNEIESLRASLVTFTIVKAVSTSVVNCLDLVSYFGNLDLMAIELDLQDGRLLIVWASSAGDLTMYDKAIPMVLLIVNSVKKIACIIFSIHLKLSCGLMARVLWISVFSKRWRIFAIH